MTVFLAVTHVVGGKLPLLMNMKTIVNKSKEKPNAVEVMGQISMRCKVLRKHDKKDFLLDGHQKFCSGFQHYRHTGFYWLRCKPPSSSNILWNANSPLLGVEFYQFSINGLINPQLATASSNPSARSPPRHHPLFRPLPSPRHRPLDSAQQASALGQASYLVNWFKLQLMI
ncbi:hypothetical protein Ancab_028547 [Ancistrocladus abbreviatus]